MVSRLGATRAQKVQQHLQRVGFSEGINFKFSGRTGNSRNSHRLMHFAARSGSDVQCRLAELLFRAYFEEEKDITNQEMLLEVGVQAGLDGGEVNRYLETSAGGNDVDAEAIKAKEDGVKGVPHFAVNGKHFDGAVDAIEFFEAFVDISSRDKPLV
jgi:predicted DsbA family dithiol-disulfide isomerase